MSRIYLRERNFFDNDYDLLIEGVFEREGTSNNVLMILFGESEFGNKFGFARPIFIFFKCGKMMINLE